MYKIRINCTSGDDLRFEQRKIRPILYPDMVAALEPYAMDFLLSIHIEHKKTGPFVKKILDIVCSERIEEEQFVEWIRFMKERGFVSKKNTIQMVDDSNTILLHYDFNTEQPSIPPKRKPSSRSTSFYSHQYLYKWLR